MTIIMKRLIRFDFYLDVPGQINRSVEGEIKAGSLRPEKQKKDDDDRGDGDVNEFTQPFVTWLNRSGS